MGKDGAAETAREPQEEIRKFAEQLRQKVYTRGYPEWGTLFSAIEELGVQIGDAVCREFVEQAVREQSEATEDGCSNCEPTILAKLTPCRRSGKDGKNRQPASGTTPPPSNPAKRVPRP
jgi:hypothetical protein